MELFGDPKTNQKGLPILKIGEFGKVKGGKRLPKGESYADHTTNHPYVRVIDMVKHSVTIPALVYLTQATHEKISRYSFLYKDGISEILYSICRKSASLLGTGRQNCLY